MRSIITTLFLLGGSAAFAQSPTFEVASVKAAAPQTDGRIFVSMGGDPGRIDYKNVSLRDLIRQAYDVKDFQINGPDWMNSARFDVQAKLPPDTSKENKQLMMQALLADRFQLKIHKESKDVPVYSLVVGKNGLKMKKAEDVPAPPSDGPATGGSAAAGGPGAGPAGGASGGAFGGRGPGGPGGRGPGGPGSMMMRMEPGGKFHLTAKAIGLPGLTDMLARQVGKPVYDNTGLAGLYDMELEFKPEEGMGMMRGLPLPMHRPDDGGEGRGPARDAVEAPSIFTAIQDQLGLRLESKKGPVDTIVVDHVEKSPTEN